MSRRVLLLAVLVLPLAACSFLGGEDAVPADVCRGISHSYAPSGTSNAQCNASATGSWIEGRCYCYGD